MVACNPLGRLLTGLVPLLLIACQSSPERQTAPQDPMHYQQIDTQSHRLAVEGRARRLKGGGLRFGYPGVTLHTRFEGRYLALRAHSTGADSYLEVRVDGQPPRTIRLSTEPRHYVLINRADAVATDVAITHRTESWLGKVTINKLLADQNATLTAPELPERKLLIIGDSVTCSYGAGDRDAPLNTGPWWNPAGSYGMRLADTLNAQVHLVCYGGRGLIRSWNGNTDEGNAPEFFEWTIPDKGSPVPWEHDRYRPDLILVSLGTNDFSLGIGPLPAESAFVGAYIDFLNRLREVHPDATIALTEGAIVNDAVDPERPQKTVLRSYIRQAIERSDQPDIHFVPATHYPGDEVDGHPTGAQHAAMADDLTRQIGQLMGW